MKLKQLLSQTRKAIDDYNMIQDGDRIAVGISGGKDSLTMLYALANLRRFYPKKFEIEAIMVHLGFENVETSEVEALCNELNVHFTLIPTQIFQIVFDIRKESNPCALCAKMRKGAFNEEAKRLGCNKIAYAHHMDDLIETLLMSLFYEGRFNSFSPVTYLDQTGLTVIRPIMYVKEKDVIGFKNLYNLPIIKSPCPADGYTKRQYVKDLVKRLNLENPGLKDRIMNAILTGDLPGWPPRPEKR